MIQTGQTTPRLAQLNSGATAVQDGIPRAQLPAAQATQAAAYVSPQTSAQAPAAQTSGYVPQTTSFYPSVRANDPYITGVDDYGETDYSVLINNAMAAGASADEVQSLLNQRVQKALQNGYSQYAYDDVYQNAMNYINRNSQTAQPALDGNLLQQYMDDILSGYRRDIERADYVAKYNDIARKDNFGGQFLASYDVGQLGQDEAMAWKDYLSNPTQANRRYAEAVSDSLQSYMQRNAAALDEDATLPLISQSLARYLPQFKEQTIAGAKGALGGAAAGSVLPGIGTVAGAKAGYAAGRAVYGYDTMQGAAFKALLDAGVDEDTARAAASDEALVNALLEGGDAVLDLLTLGSFKGISALLGGAAGEAGKSAGKKAASALAKYGINVLGEGAQEWTQEAVSLANQKRSGTGALNLVGEAVGQIGSALSGADPAALAQMNASGVEGIKVAALMGAASNLAGRAMQTGAARADTIRQANANLGDPDFVARTTAESLREFTPVTKYRPVDDNPLALNLPTAAEVYEYQPGSPLYLSRGGDGPARAALGLPVVDRATRQPYDGSAQNRSTGGRQYGTGEESSAELREVYGANVRSRAQGTDARGEGTYSQTDRAIGREEYAADWAKGHIVERPSVSAERAARTTKQYAPNVFVVEDAALKSRNPNAWALTSGGNIYISNSVPDSIADITGYHEVVHALKQRGSPDYNDFLDGIGARLERQSPDTDRVLEIILMSRAKKKSLLDLNLDELSAAYDELNAVVWGYHKADPENARAQFSGVFQDYDAYIRELDAILEQTRNGGVGPESSVGAARKGFDPWSEFQGTKSEFFPEGANAARPVDVPTTDPQGNPVRKTASTAMGAKAIPDEVVGDIQNMVMAGELSYNRVTDRASIDRAVREIQSDGFQRCLERFSSSIQKGIISKDLATLGQQLLINAANAGDANATAELLTLYAQMETTAGQAVQAASILRKLSPTAQLYAAQKVASKLEQTLTKKLKGKNITIDQELIKEFNQQTDQEGRDVVLDKIYQNIADQIPSNWRDKWNAWRYLAMLGNPRTHIRNIVGDVGFQPVRYTKDRVAAVIEAGV